MTTTPTPAVPVTEGTVMTIATRTFPPSLSDPYEAGDWLLARHNWPRHLVSRVVLTGQDRPHWLDQIADAFTDLDAHAAAWTRYEATHRQPGTYGTDAEWDAWENAGPKPSGAARALTVMSGGEKRMCRLIVTLHPTYRGGWNLADLEIDERGAVFFLDWTAVALTAFAWNKTGATALRALMAVAR
jgi:hypothetical protein